MNRPAIMGILNLTPDSFSGDGVMATADALRHARALHEAGADILDIGAESTRPGATPLSPAEEWARLGPVLEAIIAQSWRAQIRLSIDTRHAATAAHALNVGIDLLNDVGGLRDTAMLEALEAHECDVVVMHALTVPADPSVTLPEGVDVVAEILRWKADIATRAVAHGVSAHRLIYDPGIGFGKTAAQSRALIAGVAALKHSGGRWLVGHSRKSFLAPSPTATADARDAITRSYSLQLAAAGIDYLRVHDVAGHVALFEAQE